MSQDAFHGLLLGAMAGSVVLALLLLTGCAQYKTDYPNMCHVDKPDATGQGYSRAQFPCKITHQEGGTP